MRALWRRGLDSSSCSRAPGWIRAAAEDLYFNSVRLVTANALWGISLLAIIFVVSGGLILAPLLVLMIPLTMGLMRMATTQVRRRRLFWGLRRRRASPPGAAPRHRRRTARAQRLAAADVLIGLRLPGVIGPVVVIGGAYTLAAIWLLAVTTWPLLLDPARG